MKGVHRYTYDTAKKKGEGKDLGPARRRDASGFRVVTSKRRNTKKMFASDSRKLSVNGGRSCAIVLIKRNSPTGGGGGEKMRAVSLAENLIRKLSR